MTACLTGERLGSQPEPEGTGNSRTERLKLLLELLHLVGDDDLNQLLELLQLLELMLLKQLKLLQLLRDDLQQLCDLLQRRRRANAVWPETVPAAERVLRYGVDARCADSKRRSCELTHLTSSVIDGIFTARRAELEGCLECRLRIHARALSAQVRRLAGRRARRRSMVVREVYEFVTDSLVPFEKRLLTTRALRGI
jgi:hypothetical protein